MRWLMLLVSLPAVLAASDELMKVKSVYLLPMTNGLDQYLASRLTSGQFYVVTTDPQTADAIFTDSLGPGFEQKMAELYPVPKPEEKDKAEEKDEARKGDFQGDEVGKLRAYRKGHGTVFLVDRRTRQVVWSIYMPPKDSRPEKMDDAAKTITDRLRKDLVGKPGN